MQTNRVDLTYPQSFRTDPISGYGLRQPHEIKKGLRVSHDSLNPLFSN